MKLRQIEVFLAVVETGSISDAAARLHIVQSAVSVALRGFEKELGADLVVRDKRPLQLTSAGQLLLRRVAPLYSRLQAAKEEIREHVELTAGHVRVAASPMLIQMNLAAILARYMVEYAGIRLDVLQAGALEIEQDILRGDADFGVLAKRPLDADLETHTLWESTNCAAFSRAMAPAGMTTLSWEQLFEYPMAVFPNGYHLRTVCEHYALKQGKKLNIAVETANFPLLSQAVKHGIAAAVLPLSAIIDDPDIMHLALAENEHDTIKVIACWRKREVLTPAAQSLLTFLMTNRRGAGDHPPELKGSARL